MLSAAIVLATTALAQPATKDWPQWCAIGSPTVLSRTGVQACRHSLSLLLPSRHRGRNPQQQSAHTDAAAANHSQKEWTFKAADRVVSSPAVAYGRVYVGSDDGHLYCLDAATGRQVWAFAVPDLDPTCKSTCDPEDPGCDPDPEHPDDKGFQCEHGLCLCPKIRSDPAVDVNGNIYFGAYNRQFYKVSPTGTLVWNVTTGGTIYGPPTIDSDGTVYIGSFDEYIYAISAGGGIKWRSFIGAHGDSGIALGEGASAHVLMTQSNEGGNCTAWPP
jgi:hypothetical protein